MGLKKKIENEAQVIKGEKGKDKTYASFHKYTTEQEAIEGFNLAVKKLFDVTSWSDLSGPTSNFKLYNHSAEEKQHIEPEVNDYIKIMLALPSPDNWVKVIDLKKEDSLAEFTVRPCNDPLDNDNDTDHFFTSAATSTFKVERKEKTIYAYEIGKNEVINNNEESGDRGFINTLIAEGGWAGFQEYQWKKLTDYLVHLE